MFPVSVMSMYSVAEIDTVFARISGSYNPFTNKRLRPSPPTLPLLRTPRGPRGPRFLGRVRTLTPPTIRTYVPADPADLTSLPLRASFFFPFLTHQPTYTH